MARTVVIVSFLAWLAVTIPIVAYAQGTGSVSVGVVLDPELNEGTFRFSGIPAGELVLAEDPDARLETSYLAAGEYRSVLDEIDPAIQASGYVLNEIRCDDAESDSPSTGDVQNRTANFQLEVGESVTCLFKLAKAECVCPREGRWRVDNHPGQMVCTGAVSMTQPLAPSQGTGTLDVQDGCATVVAQGMSEDEATIVMHAAPNCRFEGSVGGERDGIPMTIHFTWNVLSSERIEGDLESTVSQSGMTCHMSRTYELDFEG